METDGTTPSKGGNGKRRDRRQQRQERWRQRRDLAQERLSRACKPLRHPLRRDRPMWQEPLRGALYALGSGLVALAFVWYQSRM